MQCFWQQVSLDRARTFAFVATLLSFVLIATNAGAAQAFTISGEVTSQSTGLGVSGTEVVVTESGTSNRVAVAETGLDGSYSLEVSGGTYDITFTPPLGSGFGSFVASDEAITSDKTLNVVLVPTGVTFSGVLRGEGGVPLPDDTVQVGNDSALTGSDGSFSLLLAPGTYTLLVHGSRAAGVPNSAAPTFFDFENAHVTIGADGLHQDLTLPVHALTVRTLGVGGSPLQGVVFAQYVYRALEAGVVLAPGIAPSAAEVEEEGTTAEDGTATLSVPDFQSGATIEALPPV